MRTTIDIEAPILKELREIQMREGVTLETLISRLLNEAIARRKKHSVAPAFQWTTRPMRALIDLEDKDAVASKLVRSPRHPFA